MIYPSSINPASRVNLRWNWLYHSILLGGLIFSQVKLPAQHYFTRVYTESDGLSSSMVFDVVQDSTGRLWFATRTGISCYDGIRFTNYNVNDGLRTSSYVYLNVDQHGEIRSLPQNGNPCVLKFNGIRWETACCDTTLRLTPNFTAFDVFYQDKKLVLAAGTNASGALICRNGKWRQYTVTDGLLSNRINGIAGTGDAIYIATEKGLNVLRAGSISNGNVFGSPLLSDEIFAVEAGPSAENLSDTAIWLLGENWLGYIFHGAFHLATADFYLPVKDIGKRCFLSLNGQGDAFFGNPIFVYSYSVNTGEVLLFDRKAGLITDGGTMANTDREGNLWVTGYRGITKIPSLRFKLYSDKDGLYSNEVASALEVSPGHYVFGHHGAITFYDGNRFTPFILPNPHKKGEFETRIQDMDADRQGNVWLAVSVNGVARLDRNRKLTFYMGNNGLQGFINSVLVASDGTVYAGGNSGLYKFVNGRFVNVAPDHEIIKNGVRKIFEGPDKALYLTTFSRGIIKFASGNISRITSHENPLYRNVYAVYFDLDRKAWVGTAAGLCTIRDSVITKVDSGGLVINNPIYLILKDSHGCLWFGTDNGAYRWSHGKLDHLTIQDGFSGLEVNRDAGFQDYNGHLWFGTNNGVTEFYPEYDFEDSLVPPPIVRLTVVETADDTLNLSLNHVLSSSRNNLVFHFNIASFIDEREVFYRYKLERLDDDWSEEIFAHNNQVRFNSLRPGTYRFCLKARNAIGIWSEPVCSGTIRIKNPFWRQWWFITLSLGFIAGMLFLLARLVVIRRYNLRLSKMVAIRTRDLRRSQKDLQESNEAKDNFFSIIAHDLKSPFNAILGMLELLTTEYSEFTDEERHRILMNLRSASVRTIDLVENLLTWAQSQKGLLPFSPVKFDFMELVRENLLLFEPSAKAKDITLVVPPPEDVVVFADRDMINTVIRNLISNAIKFSFPHGNVMISLERTSDQTLTVSVTDTGIGMAQKVIDNLFILDKRMTSKGTNNETGTGLGLILSKDFLTRNNGRIWAESKEGSGSTFYFTLPVNPPGKQHSKN